MKKIIIAKPRANQIITTKHDKNESSGAFNQIAHKIQITVMVLKFLGEEKRTGHLPCNLGKQKENPKAGNIW